MITTSLAAAVQQQPFFVWQFSAGSLVAIVFSLIGIWKGAPTLRLIFAFLAEHELLVSQACKNAGIARSEFASIALAHVKQMKVNGAAAGRQS